MGALRRQTLLFSIGIVITRASPDKGRHVTAFRNVYSDRIVLTCCKIIALEHPPEPSGLDPHNRIVLREAVGALEDLNGDRVTLDPVCAACKRLLHGIGKKCSTPTDMRKLRAGNDSIKLGPNIIMGRGGRVESGAVSRRDGNVSCTTCSSPALEGRDYRRFY